MQQQATNLLRSGGTESRDGGGEDVGLVHGERRVLGECGDDTVGSGVLVQLNDTYGASI